MARITEWCGEHAAIVDHHVNYIDKLARYEDIGEIGEIVPILRSHWVYKNRHRKSYRRYTGLDDFGEKHTITVKVESKGKEPYCANCGAQAAESFLCFCPRCGAFMDDSNTERLPKRAIPLDWFRKYENEPIMQEAIYKVIWMWNKDNEKHDMATKSGNS